MSGASTPEPLPTEAERQLVVDRIHQALAEDKIAFEDLDRHFAAVYDARTADELERAAASLPMPSQIPPHPKARHPAPRNHMSLIGDAEIGGWVAVGDELTVASLIGDATIDLSSAAIGPNGVTVTARALIGDVRVIVPDGARVQVDGFALIGDKKQHLSPPTEDGPLVRIQSFCLIGDVRVHSLSLVPEGALRRLWATLRQR